MYAGRSPTSENKMVSYKLYVAGTLDKTMRVIQFIGSLVQSRDEHFRSGQSALGR